MAKVLFSGIVSGIRGKLAGVIFSSSSSGPTVRPYAAPVNPRTTFQRAARGSFSSAGARWRALSSSDRALWDAWALLPAQEKLDPWGNPYYVSGWNWFLSFHQRATMAGTSPSTVPPSFAHPVAPVISQVLLRVASPNYLKVTFAAGYFDGYICAVAVSIFPSSTSTRPIAGKARTLYKGPDSVGSYKCTFNNISSYFGPIVAGQTFTALVFKQTTYGDISTGSPANGVAY